MDPTSPGLRQASTELLIQIEMADPNIVCNRQDEGQIRGLKSQATHSLSAVSYGA